MIERAVTLRDLPEVLKGAIGKYTKEFDHYRFVDNEGKTAYFTRGFVQKYPGWFKVETVYTPEDVKEGTYWKDKGECLRRIDKIGKGVIYYTNITYNLKTKDTKFLNREDDDRPAATPEIESALIREAERRGFRKGTKFKGIWGSPTLILEGNEFSYDAETDILQEKTAWIIYEKGVWADVIEQPKEEKKVSPRDPLQELIDVLKEVEIYIYKHKQSKEPCYPPIVSLAYVMRIKHYLKELEATDAKE